MSDSMMKDKLKVCKGRLYPMGLHKVHNGLSIVSDIVGKNNSGIVIYPKGNHEIKIPFEKEYLIGGLFCLIIEQFPYKEFSYLFYKDDEYVSDPYAGLVASSPKFGEPGQKGTVSRCVFCDDVYDWEGDCAPAIPFHNSIFYKLHMRGFTKHSSSGVKDKGTFAGLIEKIPYLKELGITAVQSMPIYEFDDVIFNPAYSGVDEALLPFMEAGGQNWEYKTNYWGYSQGNYMAPKRAYAKSGRADIECKDMIKALHQNGIEFIMELYFPAGTRPGFILDVCRYWVAAYHVDGFKLMGCDLPIRLLATDPYLQRTKLIFESMGNENFADLEKDRNWFKNLAVVSQGFLYDVRKYLKGDEDMLSTVAGHFKNNPSGFAVLNEITSYQGFTLEDLVSYDRKHNEANGEDNRDGSDYNYSWNCGAEGKSRRKPIVSLRNRQCRNALLMMFLSQGTPVLLAGDEFGNSADGNNNPYCQDNAISWLEWKENVVKKQLRQFVKDLIAFRKAHPILHVEDALKQMDFISCGYPDLSYHGEQAWYPEFANYNRHMGILYCGKYARIDKNKEDAFIYVAYNMHWVDHEFALPKLPASLQWKPVLMSGNPGVSTEDTKVDENDEKASAQYRINVEPRSIVVLVGEKVES